ASKTEGTTWTSRRVYAIGRHALGDLREVLRAAPRFDAPARLSEAQERAIHHELASAGITVDFDVFRERLKNLRKGYEPYATALSEELLMELPPCCPRRAAKTTGRRPRGKVRRPASRCVKGRLRAAT